MGSAAIELRDAEACRIPSAITMTEPERPAVRARTSFHFRCGVRRQFYGYGAMINLMLSRTVYPGWTCRFYVDASVPRACVAFLANNGADVRKIEDEYPGVGQFQRFLVMNDPHGRALPRTRLRRSALSRRKPISSSNGSIAGYPFHVVRGHVLHDELMTQRSVGRTHRLQPLISLN